ncbi:MAG: NusG domain II-containing protein [Clostridia bacterium]|jgi:hypothetical protein
MKKADIILISSLICVFLCIFAFSLIKSSNDFDIVTVQKDGEVIYEGPLDNDMTVDVYDDEGAVINTVVIKNREVYMEYATCPNKDCIHMGHLDAGSSKQIACLPNGVLVYLISSDEEMDGISK